MNTIKISGHVSRDAATINSVRTSGVIDTLPIKIDPQYADKDITIEGKVHTYNTPDKKLHIYIKPDTISATKTEEINTIEITGYICRSPKYRTTPNGKHITELILAIPHIGYMSDYLPCIAWGSVAKEAKNLTIGTEVTVNGRLQSRAYQKNGTDYTTVEVSINNLTTDEKTSKM